MQLNLRRAHLQTMQAHVERLAPFESCGLLAGRNNTVEEVFLIPNQIKSRTRFRMEPKEQLNAFDTIDANGLELVGIFHSHPDGPEGLSPTDIEEAAYPVVQVIWSQSNGRWQARGFWIDAHSVNEVTLCTSS